MVAHQGLRARISTVTTAHCTAASNCLHWRARPSMERKRNVNGRSFLILWATRDTFGGKPALLVPICRTSFREIERFLE
jgi:hypothetical protein